MSSLTAITISCTSTFHRFTMNSVTKYFILSVLNLLLSNQCQQFPYYYKQLLNDHPSKCGGVKVWQKKTSQRQAVFSCKNYPQTWKVVPCCYNLSMPGGKIRFWETVLFNFILLYNSHNFFAFCMFLFTQHSLTYKFPVLPIHF